MKKTMLRNPETKQLQGVSTEGEVMLLKSYTIFLITNSSFFAVIGFASLNGFRVDRKVAARLGKRASQICKQHGIRRGKIPHERYGFIYTYPCEVLKVVFEEFGLGMPHS